MSLAGETATPAADLAPPSVLTEDLSQGPPGSRADATFSLVWDAPNLDMGLGSILGRRPTALERPRFDALGRWLLARTAQAGTGARRPDHQNRTRGHRFHQYRARQRRSGPALGGRTT